MRARRLLEEGQQGRVRLTHCPTKQMIADALTKLATADVIRVLVEAMEGRMPTRTSAHRTSVTPGSQNSGDIIGDGAPPTAAEIPANIHHPQLPHHHPLWHDLLEAMYRRWSAVPTHQLPEILSKYGENLPCLYTAFVRLHRLCNLELARVVQEVTRHFDDQLDAINQRKAASASSNGSSSRPTRQLLQPKRIKPEQQPHDSKMHEA